MQDVTLLRQGTFNIARLIPVDPPSSPEEGLKHLPSGLVMHQARAPLGAILPRIIRGCRGEARWEGPQGEAIPAASQGEARVGVLVDVHNGVDAKGSQVVHYPQVVLQVAGIVHTAHALIGFPNEQTTHHIGTEPLQICKQ